MLELVGEELETRVSEGMRDRRHVRPGGRDRPAVQGHGHDPDHAPSPSRSPARPVRRGPTTTAPSPVRRRLPDAPGVEHRRRHDGDGPQRDQRAGARHAPGARAGPRRPLPRRPAEPVRRHLVCGRLYREGARSEGPDMAIARVNGLSLAYETMGAGPSLGHHSRGAIHQGIARGARARRRGLADQGNRVLIWDRPNCGESDVCFEGPSESTSAGRCARGAARTPRHGPGRHRRGFGWRPGLAAHRVTPPRRRRGPGHLVDQWRRVRPLDVGHALLRRFARRGPGRTGWRRWPPCPSGRRCWSVIRPTGSGSWTSSRRSSSRPWSVGCWPTAHATTSTCRASPTPTRGRWTSRRWSSAAVPATSTTPAPPRRHSPGCCRRPCSSNRRGAIASG